MRKDETIEEYRKRKREYYHLNKAKQQQISRSYQRKNRAAVKARHAQLRKTKEEIVREAKKFPCVDCGHQFPHPAMDFDHISNKRLEVSQMMCRAFSVATMKKEMAKCELVCAVCHRIRTWNRSHPDEQISIR